MLHLLVPMCPKSNPNLGLVMRMLYIKFHDHISFQTQVIEQKPFFLFFDTVTLTRVTPNASPSEVLIQGLILQSFTMKGQILLKLLSGNHDTETIFLFLA